MESKKVAAMFIAILCVAHVHAQKIWEDRKGCFLMQGNIAGGYLFKQHKGTAYFAGDAQYFVQNNVAVGGDIWVSIPIKKSTADGLRDNHSILGGVDYHPMKKGRFDPYIGLSPGAAFVSVNYHDAEGVAHKAWGVAPLVSGVAGFNVYIGSVFRFFVKVRGVAGEFSGKTPVTVPLHELKIAGGLGWNLRFHKVHKFREVFFL